MPNGYRTSVYVIGEFFKISRQVAKMPNDFGVIADCFGKPRRQARPVRDNNRLPSV
jgi:hypothetical protein